MDNDELDKLSTGIAGVTDLQAILRLLRERQAFLIKEPPRPTKRMRRGSEAYEDAMNAWQNEADDIDYLIRRFANYVESVQRTT